ncbi:hypothetical protein [Streptomyces sp. NPDC055094]
MTSTDHPADYPGAVLTYGMEYRLPDISVRLPLEVVPGYQEMRPRVHAWARRYLLEYFGENEQDSRCTDSFLRQGMCYWTAAVLAGRHPRASVRHDGVRVLGHAEP